MTFTSFIGFTALRVTVTPPMLARYYKCIAFFYYLPADPSGYSMCKSLICKRARTGMFCCGCSFFYLFILHWRLQWHGNVTSEMQPYNHRGKLVYRSEVKFALGESASNFQLHKSRKLQSLLCKALVSICIILCLAGNLFFCSELRYRKLSV